MSPIRIAVTGTKGQVARCLLEQAAGAKVDVIALGRPNLDLSRPETIKTALAATAADVIVSAGAYTDVNQAESEPALAD
jgi:dTDP-4-dehydrorhamnose reductase